MTEETVACVGWRRSHPDTLRWRAYYAAFEIKHRRESTNDEFDPTLSQIVQCVLTVVRAGMEEPLRD